MIIARASLNKNPTRVKWERTIRVACDELVYSELAEPPNRARHPLLEDQQDNKFFYWYSDFSSLRSFPVLRSFNEERKRRTSHRSGTVQEFLASPKFQRRSGTCFPNKKQY